MHYLYSVAEELVRASNDLFIELQSAANTPSREQLDTLQAEVNKIHERLNRIQTELDVWLDFDKAA